MDPGIWKEQKCKSLGQDHSHLLQDKLSPGLFEGESCEFCMDNGICKIKTITELNQQTLKRKLTKSRITVVKAGMPAGAIATNAPPGQAEGRNPVITAFYRELGVEKKPFLSPLSKVRRCRLPETRTMCRTTSQMSKITHDFPCSCFLSN